MVEDQIKQKAQAIDSPDAFHKQIMDAQDKMIGIPGSMQGAALDAYCPLKHSFGDGLYIREIFMPKGTLVMSKIHKKTHPYFVLKGICLVVTEEGTVKIEAPFQGMTMAGTKRALYIVEDTTWICVHRTDETDLKKIEEDIIAEDFEAYEKFKRGG